MTRCCLFCWLFIFHMWIYIFTGSRPAVCMDPVSIGYSMSTKICIQDEIYLAVKIEISRWYAELLIAMNCSVRSLHTMSYKTASHGNFCPNTKWKSPILYKIGKWPVYISSSFMIFSRRKITKLLIRWIWTVMRYHLYTVMN